MALTQVDQGLLGTYAQYTGFKNRILNGQMVIDQRNAGASVSISANAYTLDRMFSLASGGGVYTVQQSSTVPSSTGFRNSAIYTVTTPDSSIAATDYYGFDQRIEGYNVADLNFGNSGATPFTVSFWVRSSVTGTYSFALFNNAADRSYVTTYTINSANTWEQKSITITPDTSGTWATTNAIGVTCRFALGVGSTYTTSTLNSWQTGLYFNANTAANWIATNGATFYITGVQLEKGSTATSFDYRPYGQELQLCQRYCYKIATSGGYSTYATTGMFISTTRVDFPILFPTYMRASPTGTYTAANTYLPSSAGTDFTPSAVASVAGSASPQAITVTFTVSGATAGRAATLTDLNTASSNMIFSAEL